MELVNKYHKSYSLNESSRKKPSTRKEPISLRKHRRPQKKERQAYKPIRYSFLVVSYVVY